MYNGTCSVNLPANSSQCISVSHIVLHIDITYSFVDNYFSQSTILIINILFNLVHSQ